MSQADPRRENEFPGWAWEMMAGNDLGASERAGGGGKASEKSKSVNDRLERVGVGGISLPTRGP